jgi:hypothetical protein
MRGTRFSIRGGARISDPVVVGPKKRSSALLPVCSNPVYGSDDRERNTDDGHVHPALPRIFRAGHRIYFLKGGGKEGET